MDMNFKIQRRGLKCFCFSVRGLSWITHSDDPPPTPFELGWEYSISSFFLNSQILKQKPQTKAICALRLVRSGIWMSWEEGPQTKTTSEAISPSSGLHNHSNKPWTSRNSQATGEGLIPLQEREILKAQRDMKLE